jgi:hypothetical protein
MKTASSIRYGGLLIDAEDCNYESFKHLGLLCPICKRSVFLVGASQRETHTRKNKDGSSTQVKECIVPSHFSHHPDVDRSQVLDCELRSQQLSQTQRLAIAAKARNQRQKIMQRHFWKICKTSIKLQDSDDVSATLKMLWSLASMRSPEATKRLYQLLLESLRDQFVKPGQLDHTKNTLEQGLNKWVSDMEDDELTPSKYLPLIKIWKQKLDLKMQEMIVKEALDFVCQKMQKPIFLKILENSLYEWIIADSLSMQHEDNVDKRVKEFNKIKHDISVKTLDNIAESMVKSARRLIGLDKQEFEIVFCFIRDDVTQTLSLIDWAGQFEKLENIGALK